jgi:hypothetical protein
MPTGGCPRPNINTTDADKKSCQMLGDYYQNCSSNAVSGPALMKCVETNIASISPMCLNGGIEMNQPECMCEVIKKVYSVCYPQNCPAVSYLSPCKMQELETNWYCDTKNKCAIGPYQPKPVCPGPPIYNINATSRDCETFDKAVNTCMADTNITTKFQKCVETTGLSALSAGCRDNGLEMNLPECMCSMLSVYSTCFSTHCTTLSYLAKCPKNTYESDWYCDPKNKCSLSPGYSNV